jgi:NADPH:quinone reductase-like Zn-dependent oxidoreductase
MRAAIVRAHGGVPELEEVDDPEPSDGSEVLEVEAAGMNPVDVRIASGEFALERHKPPYVAGKEGVGRRSDGSLVYFDWSRDRFGAFAERTLIDAGGGYPVPNGLDPALAVCLGVSGLAAWMGLEWRGRLAYGETVLVLGASGVVGQIAVQAAKLLRAGRVVAAARDDQALKRARSLGADAIVRLGDGRPLGDPARRTARHTELVEALREASGGDGYHVVLDPLWGEPAAAAIATLVPYGRLIHVGQSAGIDVTLSSPSLRSKPIDLLGYTNYNVPEEQKAAAYERMTRLARDGELRVEIERLRLDDVPAAWERQGTSPHRKLVIRP